MLILRKRQEVKVPAEAPPPGKVEPHGQEPVAPMLRHNVPKLQSSFAKAPEDNRVPPRSGDRNFLRRRVKFEIYGEEMIHKKVKPSGASGRVYLPPDWVDRNVKIIRID